MALAVGGAPPHCAWSVTKFRPTLYVRTIFKKNLNRNSLLTYRVGRNLVTDHAGGGGVLPTAKAINPTI